METRQTSIWIQIAPEKRNQVIAILVEMLLDYLEKQAEKQDEPS